MRLIGPISEDEVIAIFLRGELDSDRYGEKLRAFVSRDGRDLDVLLTPNVTDAAENAYRRGLLEEHRAYERRDGLFGGFPRRVDWFRAVLSREEVLEILYINWDWWLRLSGGSRRPRDAARRIRAGETPGVGTEEHEPFATALASGASPPLIAATTPAHLPLVLVEGHVRLTAYALFPSYVPDELEIVVGVSDEMRNWCQF